MEEDVKRKSGMPGTLVLDEEFPRPDEVDVAKFSAELFHRLLEGGDGAAADAEHVEEFIPKGLPLGFFADSGLPFA